MSDIKDCIKLNVKVKELRDLLWSKNLPNDISAEEVFRLEEEAYQLSLKMLNKEDHKAVDLESIKNMFAEAVENISIDANKVRDSITMLANLDIDNFTAPVAITEVIDDKLSVKFLKNVPSNTNLYLSPIVNSNNVVDLTLEDIRSCGSMGDYEKVLLPFVEKVLKKFKEKNNI